ncbi:RloB family protein [Candidatus Electronema sp. PJ]|uniref:RloB family protein n=1 Tax=Candidatus Electronema sp. PJ TaxID=3401572 RepID=UPI003AA8F7F0
MPPKRRTFGRPQGKRLYHKLFVLAVEGEKTEPEYFALFKNVGVKCLPGTKKTSCTQVLKRLKHFLEKENVREPYEAWLVIDKDDNSEEKLQEVYKWSQLKEQYGFALSNPNFEYWLLLHFEDGSNIHSVRDCSDRLKRYLPDYNKGIDERKITVDAINKAILHAKQRDNLSCLDWPKDIYGTTVYKLIEKLLSSECF